MCVVTQQYNIYSKTATFFEKSGENMYPGLAVALATWYNSDLKRLLALMSLVKPASHRLCGKGWTNNINTRYNHPKQN